MSKTRNTGNLSDVIQAGVQYPALINTPAQFDASTNLVSSAFLQRQGVQSSGVYAFQVNTALTAAHMGGVVYGYGTTNLIWNLPAAGNLAFPTGTTVTIMNAGPSTIQISSVNSDTINMSTTQITALVLQNGETVTLTWILNGSSGTWFASGGTASLRYQANMGFSAGGVGYQRLPSGFIIQWNSSFTTSASAYVAWTYPIAFPHGTLSAWGVVNSTSAGNISVSINGFTTTYFNVASFNSSNAYAAAVIQTFAIGW